VFADKEKYQLMLIDDQPQILRGLEVLVDSTEIAEVIATANEGSIAIARALEVRPDLITVDVSMPGMTGIEITKALKSKWHDVRILAISAFPNELYVRSMIDAGAQGYLLKDNAPEELKTAIESIMSGRQWIGEGLSIPTINQ